MNNYLVYLLRCSDGSLYCGITNNLNRRIKQHNNGTGAKYTKAHRPVALEICSDSNMSRSEAMKLEYKIKQLRRADKVRYLKEYGISRESL